MICVATAGTVIALAASQFTLGWSHSVTHTRWEEVWHATPEGLRPVEAMIQGPGAGMELPEDAWRVDGGWRYRPRVPPQPEVWLASSGATRGGWRLCALGDCHEIGATEGDPVRLWQAGDCAAALGGDAP